MLSNEGWGAHMHTVLQVCVVIGFLFFFPSCGDTMRDHVIPFAARSLFLMLNHDDRCLPSDVLPCYFRVVVIESLYCIQHMTSTQLVSPTTLSYLHLGPLPCSLRCYRGAIVRGIWDDRMVVCKRNSSGAADVC